MALDQTTRLLNVAAPKGEELFLTSFTGREELSRLFSFQLEMISDNAEIKPQDMVGENITFTVAVDDDDPRYFNGTVRAFYAGDEADGRRMYRAEVVPWLWFLTRTSDCRVFQDSTVLEIVEELFDEYGFSDYEIQCNGEHPPQVYSVQFRETAFQYITRLLEEEGIYYYFKHENGKHTMVIADHVGAYTDGAQKEVDYPNQLASASQVSHITSWEHCYEFKTGKFAQRDYNFETPSNELETNTATTIDDVTGHDGFEFFDFPGGYPDTDAGDRCADGGRRGQPRRRQWCQPMCHFLARREIYHWRSSFGDRRR
jgi:type VI secretion system secreted protein VgrG